MNNAAVETPSNNAAIENKSVAHTYHAFSQGITPEESVRYYSERFAHDYDKDVVGNLSYHGPEIAADLVVAHLPPTVDRATFQILDIACGTGLVGVILHKLGFLSVDGLDASRGMLDEARNKGPNVYRHLFERFLYADKPVADIADEAYDMVISSGAFANAHVPPRAVNELVRMVKRQVGLIGLVYRPVPSSDDEGQYQTELHTAQQQLIDDGVIRIVYDKLHDNYTNNDQFRYGRAVVFQRLK